MKIQPNGSTPPIKTHGKGFV